MNPRKPVFSIIGSLVLNLSFVGSSPAGEDLVFKGYGGDLFNRGPTSVPTSRANQEITMARETP